MTNNAIVLAMHFSVARYGYIHVAQIVLYKGIGIVDIKL